MYRFEGVVTLQLPFSEELLDELFGEFGWDRTQAGDPHPETTGNCSGHPRPRGFDDGESGEYQNAAYYCPHCYHSGHPARMIWDWESVTIEVCSRSSKPIRALLAAQRVEGENSSLILGLSPQDLKEAGFLDE